MSHLEFSKREGWEVDEKARADSMQIIIGKAAAKHFDFAFLFYGTNQERNMRAYCSEDK